jgi:hypothetical protein
MRFPRIFAAIGCVAFALASPAQADRSADISWAKPGVSLSAYTQDATECTETSRYVTAYIKPDTLRKLDALSSAKLLETVMNLEPSNDMNIVSAITKLHSENEVAARTNTFTSRYSAIVSFDVRDQLQAVIDKCLLERGYTPIRLSKDQLKSLSNFKRHSPERTAYLHSIDSAPLTVNNQRIDYQTIASR